MTQYTTASGETAYINTAASGDILVQVFGAITREHALSVASEALTANGINGEWTSVEDYNDVSAGWWLNLRPSENEDVR